MVGVIVGQLFNVKPLTLKRLIGIVYLQLRQLVGLEEGSVVVIEHELHILDIVGVPAVIKAR